MSKGSKRRPTSESFKDNYDNIKWGNVKWKPPVRQYTTKTHHIMPDIEPYRAVGPEAGAVISSRSKEREYLKRHNLQQVGDEKEYFFKNNGKSDDNPTREW